MDKSLAEKIKRVDITQNEISHFKTKGFIQIDDVLDVNLVTEIRSKVEPLFEGKFPTDIWPDEWNYRKGLSVENSTREIVNIWKCDPFFAKIAFNENIGKMVCDLMGWSGWYHQDGPYLDFLPAETIAIWVPLNDVSIENGTLEYAIGSHNWKTSSGMVDDFHNPLKFKLKMEDAAKIEGIEKPDIHMVTLKRGGVSFHHGKLWHGSSKNPSSTKERCAFAFHFIPENCVFNDNTGFFYGRYKLFDSNRVEESFFPITYSSSVDPPLVSSYPFQSKLNTLQLVIRAKLYGRFVKRGIVDGRITSIDNVKLNDLDDESNYYTSDSFIVNFFN
ncbi:hypothetical protein ACTFIY_000343 [Dictyostelium cf. discoideum]